MGFESLTEALDLTTPAGRAMARNSWPSSLNSNGRPWVSEPEQVWPMGKGVQPDYATLDMSPGSSDAQLEQAVGAAQEL